MDLGFVVLCEAYERPENVKIREGVWLACLVWNYHWLSSSDIFCLFVYILRTLTVNPNCTFWLNCTHAYFEGIAYKKDGSACKGIGHFRNPSIEGSYYLSCHVFTLNLSIQMVTSAYERIRMAVFHDYLQSILNSK